MLSGDVGAPYTCEILSSRANSFSEGRRCEAWGRRMVLMGGSRAMGRFRTGSGPGGSSPKDSVPCAAGVPGRSRKAAFHSGRCFRREGAWPFCFLLACFAAGDCAARGRIVGMRAGTKGSDFAGVRRSATSGFIFFCPWERFPANFRLSHVVLFFTCADVGLLAMLY